MEEVAYRGGGVVGPVWVEGANEGPEGERRLGSATLGGSPVGTGGRSSSYASTGGRSCTCRSLGSCGWLTRKQSRAISGSVQGWGIGPRGEGEGG